MSHEITKTDGLVLANNEKAWHGLGTVVSHAPTLEEAFKLAGLDWKVEQHPLNAVETSETGERLVYPIGSHVLNVRSDTKEQLGVVGSKYEVIQNEELMQFIEEVFKVSKTKIYVETAGSIRGGKRTWALVRLGQFDVKNTEDEIRTYALFTNGHDGLQGFIVTSTGIRVVCKNTMNAALADSRVVKLKHTKNIKERVSVAKQCLGVAHSNIEKLETTINTLASANLTVSDVESFFLKVHQTYFAPGKTNPTTTSEERAYTRAVNTIAEWSTNMDDSRQRVSGIEGTAWAAVNAITQWADHERKVRVVDSRSEEESRLESNLYGSSAKFKRHVFKTGLALC